MATRICAKSRFVRSVIGNVRESVSGRELFSSKLRAGKRPDGRSSARVEQLGGGLLLLAQCLSGVVMIRDQSLGARDRGNRRSQMARLRTRSRCAMYKPLLTMIAAPIPVQASGRSSNTTKPSTVKIEVVAASSTPAILRCRI